MPDSVPSTTPGQRRLRVALVVQRYGLEINGGAELLARLVVEQIRGQHDVEVLTTCARDYTTWDMHYAPGEQLVDGIPVHRFAQPLRSHDGRARIPKPHKLRRSLFKGLPWLHLARVARPKGDAEWDGLNYMRRQGPFVPALVQHLKQAGDRYEVVIYVTALYYPIACGILECPQPALLIPNLHDEAAMYLPLFHHVFRRPRWILWNTDAERDTAKLLYGKDITPGEVCGIGVDVSLPAAEQLPAVRQRYAVPGDYVVFVGRVAAAKGFDTLLEAFAAHRRHAARPLSLVVVGQVFEDSLRADGVVYTGFIEMADKNALIAGASACIVSSRHESLSLVLLESFALGTPVIANGESAVLRQHIERTGAGVVYRGARGLARAIDTVAAWTPERRQAMAESGRRYVEERYNWPRIRATLESALQRVAGKA